MRKIVMLVFLIGGVICALYVHILIGTIAVLCGLADLEKMLNV